MERYRPQHEDDDWLDGVRSGIQAEKRRATQRLHWILDPLTKSMDIQGASELLARLNQREVLPDDDTPEWKDENRGGTPGRGGEPKHPRYPGFGPPSE